MNYQLPTGSETDALSTQRRRSALVGMVLVLAVFLRVASVFHSPVLETDEAALALNIEGRSFTELTHPLEFDQGAPIGFLWLAKLNQMVLGTSTTAYRVLPFLFGFASVALALVLASRVVPQDTVVWGLALVAVSGALCRFSGYFKQYSSDALASLLLMLLLQPFTGDSNRRFRAADMLYLSAMGAGLLWFSHPLIFVASGCGLCIALRFFSYFRWRELAWLVAMGLCWLLSFAVHYLLFTGSLSSNAYLHEFWAGSMLPYPLTLGLAIRWVVHSGLDLAGTSLGITHYSPYGLIETAIALTLGLCGCHALLRTRRWMCLLLVLPVLFTFAAATLRMYPFGDRLILFLVPAFLLLVGHGFTVVTRNHNWLWKAVGVAAVASLVASMARLPVRGPENHHQQLVEACRYVSERLGPRDQVYIFYPNRYLIFYYLEKGGVSRQHIVIGIEPLGKIDRFQTQFETWPVTHYAGLWAIFSHKRVGPSNVDEGEIVRSLLVGRCSVVEEVAFGVARVVRYDCRGSGFRY